MGDTNALRFLRWLLIVLGTSFSEKERFNNFKADQIDEERKNKVEREGLFIGYLFFTFSFDGCISLL